MIKFGLPRKKGGIGETEALMYWPDGSTRLLSVEMDLAEGKNTILVDGEYVTVNVVDGIAIVDPKYLCDTGIIPPCEPAGDNVYDNNYFPELFKNHGLLNYETSNAADWLFDRVTTTCIAALRTGKVEYYKEARESYQYWNSKLQRGDFCKGGLDISDRATSYADGGRGCDAKLIYAQPIKMFAVLFGEISSLIDAGQIADTSWDNPDFKIHGLVEQYTNINKFFTERHAGITLQSQVCAWELTGEQKYLDRCHTAINNLYEMATNNPDGEGSNGYLSHSWSAHEGYGEGYITGSEDRVFSPWMQACVADPLWQLYNLLPNGSYRDKCKKLLIGFGEAITKYGVDASRMPSETRQAIESAYDVKLFDYDHKRYTGCGLTKSPYVRYVANHLMASDAMSVEYDKKMNGADGWYSDQHIPECLFQVAVSYSLEEEALKKKH